MLERIVEIGRLDVADITDYALVITEAVID
jgi:hypothetical protein